MENLCTNYQISTDTMLLDLKWKGSVCITGVHTDLQLLTDDKDPNEHDEGLPIMTRRVVFLSIFIVLPGIHYFSLPYLPG